MIRRRLSLRARAYAVVVAVVLAPLAFVALAGRLGAVEMDAMRDRAAAAAAQVAGRLAAAPGGAGEGTLDLGAIADDAARHGAARVRVFDGAGRAVHDADHDGARSLRDRLGDVFFGPGGAPTLRAHEDALPPPEGRPELREARAAGRSDGCALALAGRLVVCHAAVSAGPFVVLAQTSSPRAIRAFSDALYPLLKLTAYVLLLGVALAAWLGRRIVRPIEALRAQVMARAAAPRGPARIDVPTRDELGDLAGAFNTLLAALDARSRANEAFAADLAHELKSPVAAVSACAEALERGGPPDAERTRRLARALGDSSRKLDALVTRFLELARAEAGLQDEARAPVAVDALARGLVAALEADARYAGVRFEVDAAPAAALGAAPHLESALRNVLENAASFSGDGGSVRVAVRAEGGAAVVEIEDSGPGIAPEHLPRVFDRFFTARRDGRGTGLGLALAKAVVEAHGGAITARSDPGRGATFTLRLPAISHAFHAPPADVSPPI